MGFTVIGWGLIEFFNFESLKFEKFDQVKISSWQGQFLVLTILLSIEDRFNLIGWFEQSQCVWERVEPLVEFLEF